MTHNEHQIHHQQSIASDQQPMTMPLFIAQAQRSIVPKLLNSVVMAEAQLLSNPRQWVTHPASRLTPWWRQLKSRRLIRTGLGLLGLSGLVLWAQYHGILLLATLCGMGTMIGVYRLYSFNWSVFWSRISQGMNSADRRLIFAVASGGLVSIGTYWIVSLLINTDNIWMAISLILQNCALLSIGGLLLWQFLRQGSHQNQARVNQLLLELTHDDPLKRLIAIRQITHLVLKSSDRQVKRVNYIAENTIPILTRSQLKECFRLMLRQEPEPLVRNGLLDGLQQLDCDL